jgi:hypothetical protein
MAKLTEELVDSMAPNASAIKNGWGLVKKKQFVRLNISEDGSVLFGECIGSGQSNYLTSVDFVGETPVARCNCPSRQFPCKHSLGLLYSFVTGANFTTAPIPDDLQDKRTKAAARQEKKKEQTKTPRKVNKTALEKKLKAQLEGLEVLERQLHSIVRLGLAAIDAKKLKALEDTAKQLGNYYLKELQNELREFILLWQLKLPEEELFSVAAKKIQILYSSCKKGREHLSKRLEDPALTPDTSSSIEERLGHVWQLSELRERNMMKTNVQLAQLSFSTIINEARKEFIDEGIWLDLEEGNIYYSKNYRPFRAAKQMKEEDSVFSTLSVKELYLYPSEGNRRVRWEEYQLGVAPDTKVILSLAKHNLAEALKQVRGQLRLPLADKHPVVLVCFSKIGEVDGHWVLEGQDGTRLTLTNGESNSPDTLTVLELLSKQDMESGAVLLRLYHDLDTGSLAGKPLTIITSTRIIRLLG